MSSRPQEQSRAEWWADFDAAEVSQAGRTPQQARRQPPEPASDRPAAQQPAPRPQPPAAADPEPGVLTGNFHFTGEWQTFMGRYGGAVALSFVHESGEAATKFYNADISRYRAGTRRPFIPPERGNFRALYLEATGGAPRRWCRVSQSLHKLMAAAFVGEARRAVNGKGEHYWHLGCLEVAR